MEESTYKQRAFIFGISEEDETGNNTQVTVLNYGIRKEYTSLHLMKATKVK